MFTQDELRMIEYMARTYATKKNRNIADILRKLGNNADPNVIARMEKAAKMAISIQEKSASYRKNKTT